MRHLIYLLIASLVFTNLHAQVSGYTKDQQGAPIKGATISLLAGKDSAVVKLAASKDNGAYNFLNINPGKYLIKASSVEHAAAFSAPFELGARPLIVPDLKLGKLPNNLKEVVVTAQKPMLEV